MNLKNLITIKFVITILAIITLVYFGGNINDSYSKLEKQNKILIDQKKLYEEILKLDVQNVEDKKKIYEIIKKGDLESESKFKLNKYNIETNIWIFIAILLIIFNLFNLINSKIEKLKNEEKESEREKFL